MKSHYRKLVVAGLITVSGLGCNTMNNRYLQQSQWRTQQLYQQNRGLAMQRDGLAQSLGQANSEKQQLEQQASALRQNLDLANQRIDNLLSSNQSLEQRVQNMLASARNGGGNPLSDDANRRLEDLKRRYPDFDFDPQTGVSKFHSDLLFSSGSDELRPEGLAILQEFASIMNSSDANHLNILVVGHTDNQPISKQTTKAKHPTNWHLSTNRANSVVFALKKQGVKENRMGAAGYSEFQPVAPNSDEKSRSKNRRVEIFVLAPDAVVAGWDPDSRVN